MKYLNYIASQVNGNEKNPLLTMKMLALKIALLIKKNWFSYSMFTKNDWSK